MLAQSIADFHLKTDPFPSSSPFGSFESIKNVVMENFAETEPGIGSYFSREDFLAIKTYQERYLKNNQDQFFARKESGKIKSCHGDLHLGNICYFDKKVVLFDCIEFSEDFRNIDVLYDIAFTIMDFQFRGFTRLANLLLNQYLEWTADYEGLSLLSFYCSVRAYIRAKVTFLAFKSQKPESNQEAQAQISNYITLAKSYADTNPGLLLIVCGVSGSGKSTIARELAIKLDAIHLRSDVIRKHLGQVGILNKGDASLYSDEMNENTYSNLERLAFLLQTDRNVIVDAKFDHLNLREPYIRKKISGKPVLFIHCTAPAEDLRVRLENRNGDISDADASLIESQQKQWQNFNPEEKSDVLVLNTCQDLKNLINDCLEFIEESKYSIK
ncbi:MAG: AAA family ATPase [Oligoflexales bacterium]